MNNATCVANYDDYKYSCECAPGYLGKDCEGDIKMFFP